jgi:hypothetical protein
MFVFVWTGRGFWALLFPILFVFVLGMVCDLTFGEAVLDSHTWLYGVAVVAGAFATWVCGRRWNGTTGLKPWDFGAMVRRRREHRAFALPMELWAAPTLLIGVWMIAANLLPTP